MPRKTAATNPTPPSSPLDSQAAKELAAATRLVADRRKALEDAREDLEEIVLHATHDDAITPLAVATARETVTLATQRLRGAERDAAQAQRAIANEWARTYAEVIAETLKDSLGAPAVVGGPLADGEIGFVMEPQNTKPNFGFGTLEGSCIARLTAPAFLEADNAVLTQALRDRHGYRVESSASERRFTIRGPVAEKTPHLWTSSPDESVHHDIGLALAHAVAEHSGSTLTEMTSRSGSATVPVLNVSHRDLRFTRDRVDTDGLRRITLGVEFRARTAQPGVGPAPLDGLREYVPGIVGTMTLGGRVESVKVIAEHEGRRIGLDQAGAGGYDYAPPYVSTEVVLVSRPVQH